MIGYHAWTGRILLVDDDPLMQQTQEAILHRAGMKTQIEGTLGGALAALSMPDHELQCVILDLGLPDVSRDAAEAGESVRGVRRLAPMIPLVVLTGSATINQSILRNHYAQEWVPKTSKPEALVCAVRCAVARMAGVEATIKALDKATQQ